LDRSAGPPRCFPSTPGDDPWETRVRDELWHTVTEVVGNGAAVLVHPAATEQGYAVRTAGTRRRVPVDFDGLTLIRMTATPKVKETQYPS
jgi:CRISPR-associated protein Cas2